MPKFPFILDAEKREERNNQLRAAMHRELTPEIEAQVREYEELNRMEDEQGRIENATPLGAFVDPRSPVQGLEPFDDYIDPPARATLYELAWTGMQMEQTVASTFDRQEFLSEVPDWTYDPDFNLEEMIRGTPYEAYAKDFAGTSNYNEFQRKATYIDSLIEKNEVLDQHGPHGVFARLMGGVWDPINFLPIGAGVAKGVGRAALGVAATAAVESAATEAILHRNIPVRTIEESMYGIGGGTLLGGALGGAAGTWARIASSRVRPSEVAREIGEAQAHVKNGLRTQLVDLRNAESPDEVLEVVNDVVFNAQGRSTRSDAVGEELLREAAMLADDVASGRITPEQMIDELGGTTFSPEDAFNAFADQLDVQRRMAIAPTRRSVNDPPVESVEEPVQFAARSQKEGGLVGFGRNWDTTTMHLDAPHNKGADKTDKVLGFRVSIDHQRIYDPDDVLPTSRKLEEHEAERLKDASDDLLLSLGFDARIYQVTNEFGQATREVRILSDEVRATKAWSDRGIQVRMLNLHTNRDMKRLENLVRIFCG